MNTNKIKNSVLGAFVLAALSACGNDPVIQPLPYDPLNPYAYGGMGNCAAPQGVKDRTVYANFGNGASLIVDIYRRGTQIEAIGELNIPSIASLYGSIYSGTQAVGLPQQQVRTAVCTNGALGTLEAVSPYEEIEIALRGNGVYIEMGSRIGPVPAYVVGSVIEGNVYMEFSGGNAGMISAPGQTFLSVRP